MGSAALGFGGADLAHALAINWRPLLASGLDAADAHDAWEASTGASHRSR